MAPAARLKARLTTNGDPLAACDGGGEVEMIRCVIFWATRRLSLVQARAHGKRPRPVVPAGVSPAPSGGIPLAARSHAGRTCRVEIRRRRFCLAHYFTVGIADQSA